MATPKLTLEPSHFNQGSVSLASILLTDELNLRPSRPPNYQAENLALGELAATLADSPRTVLQKLVEIALKLCKADSAGVSLLSKEDGGKTFYWPAVAGAWSHYVGGGTPRDFGPCGVVLDRNAMQLFTHPERYYPYLVPVTPPIEEALLTPFYVKGEAVGTVWLIAHEPSRMFDAEDLRHIVNLGNFAAGAYQVLQTLDALEEQGKALREADRRKDEFLAILAHELRNPLAPIQNAVQVLRGGYNDTVIASVSEMLDRQAGQLVRLVDDLLDVNRISRGKIKLKKKRVELTSVINHAVETIQPLLMNMGHELTITTPQQIHLNADPARLAQVVDNLLNNAAKYTEIDGHIWLSVEISGLDQPEAIIRIRDNGIGIAADQLPHLFEWFTQGDMSQEFSRDGLGIGLALVKNLVKMHGGSVEAHSAGIGQGSEFIVHLPIMTEEPPTAAVADRS